MTCQSEAGSRRVLGRREQAFSARLSHKRSALDLCRTTADLVHLQSSAAEKRIGQASSLTRCYPHFRIGERVLARWTDRRFYPASISTVIGTGQSYKVNFDDGFTKIVGAGNIRVISHATRPKGLAHQSSRDANGRASEESEQAAARRQRFARRSRASADSTGSTDASDTGHSAECSSLGSPVSRRIGVLSESLQASSTASRAVCENFQSMGSYTDCKLRDCSASEAALRNDENDGVRPVGIFRAGEIRQHHVEARMRAGEESPVNGMKLSSITSSMCGVGGNVETSTAVCSANGHHGPQTVGEVTQACSTSQSHLSSANTSSDSQCNGFHHRPHTPEHTDMSAFGLLDMGLSNASGELKPVLFPKIPDMPPLSPHSSPLHNRSSQLSESMPASFFSDLQELTMERRRHSSSPVNGGCTLQPAALMTDLSKPTLDVRHSVASLDSPPLRLEQPEQVQRQKRKRRKLADAVLEPPPKIIAPKEVVPVADHNLYKCSVENCDKSFRKLNRLEYHLKYYHPDCKRELEDVLRQQEDSRQLQAEPSKVAESVKSSDAAQSDPTSSSVRNKDQKRPPPRRRDNSGSEKPPRKTLKDSKPADDSSTTAVKPSPTDTSKPVPRQERLANVPVKRRRRSSENETRPSKRMREDGGGQKQMKGESKSASGAASRVWHDRKAVRSRRSLSFSTDDDVMSSPESGHFSGLRKLAIKLDRSNHTSFRSTHALPSSAVVCCPCREDHQRGSLIKCNNCHCYQHATCVPLTTAINYRCPSCLRPPGLRKGARFKYTGVSQNGGVLPWAGLAGKLRLPLGTHVSSLWQDADGLSWKTLMQSLSIAQQVTREVQAVQEVLHITGRLLHHLRNPDSLKSVQRHFLPPPPKVKPMETDTCVQEPAESDNVTDGMVIGNGGDTNASFNGSPSEPYQTETNTDTLVVKWEPDESRSGVSLSSREQQLAIRSPRHALDEVKDTISLPASLQPSGIDLSQPDVANQENPSSSSSSDQHTPLANTSDSRFLSSGKAIIFPPAATAAAAPPPPPQSTTLLLSVSSSSPVVSGGSSISTVTPASPSAQQDRLFHPVHNPSPSQQSSTAQAQSSSVPPNPAPSLPSSLIASSTLAGSSTKSVQPSPAMTHSPSTSSSSQLTSSQVTQETTLRVPAAKDLDGEGVPMDCTSALNETSSKGKSPGTPEDQSASHDSNFPSSRVEGFVEKELSAQGIGKELLQDLNTAASALSREEEEQQLEIVRNKALTYVEEQHESAKERLIQLEHMVTLLEEFDSESCSADIHDDSSRLSMGQGRFVEAALNELTRLKEFLHL